MSFFFWVPVIEAKGSQGGAPRVVERWGELYSSKCVLAASINDRKDDLVCVGCCKLFSLLNFEFQPSVSLLAICFNFFWFQLLV